MLIISYTCQMLIDETLREERKDWKQPKCPPSRQRMHERGYSPAPKTDPNVSPPAQDAWAGAQPGPEDSPWPLLSSQVPTQHPRAPLDPSDFSNAFLRTWSKILHYLSLCLFLSNQRLGSHEKQQKNKHNSTNQSIVFEEQVCLAMNMAVRARYISNAVSYSN